MRLRAMGATTSPSSAPPIRRALATLAVVDVVLLVAGLLAAQVMGEPVNAAPTHASPFHVERDRPRVDGLLAKQLEEAAPTDVLRVFVHAASAQEAENAAAHAGLGVITTFDQVGVAAAVGLPAAIREVTATKGVSFVEADRPVRTLMDTAPTASRSTDARNGFDVTYLEPQPDKPGTSKEVCSTKRVKNKRTGRVRRVRSCRTVTTPPQPQPPITRTAHSPGVDGSGVTIAVIDSGVDGTHPMFRRPDGSSKVVRNFKPVPATCGLPVFDCYTPKRTVDELFV